MELQVIQPTNNNGGMMEVAISRQAQEVQAAMVIAQRFPRDINRAFTRAIEDCKRKSLAEKAAYSYPRGKETVTGPSIRLAEAIAKAWGNIDFGVIELERKSPVGSLAGESTVMTYSWDLETNVRSQNVFTVAHKRNTKQGSYNLTDERDIYEMVANYASRRKRANILSTVPADFVDKCLEQCRLTLKNTVEPLVDRIRKMVLAFKDVGVSQEMLEQRLGHKLDVTTADEIIDLFGIFNSIKDGHADRKDFFQFESNVDNTDESKNNKPPEPQSISGKPKDVKNFAPQTDQEAQRRKTELSKQSGPEQNPEQKAVTRRKDLIKNILEISSQYGQDIVYKFSPKQNLAELTLEEIETLFKQITESLGKEG